MSLFDRLTNPIWHSVLGLDRNRQRIAAMLITGYGACRQTVCDTLVIPLELGHILQTASGTFRETRERLIDEALVGLLKSCTIPQNDPEGKVPDRIVQSLADVWGLSALADRNHRIGCAEPKTLKESAYSADMDEARTQVLANWTAILGISEPTFVTDANKQWFYTGWRDLSVAMIGGFLKGFGRTPDDILLKKAKSEASGIPPHRLAETRFMLEALGRSSVSPAKGRSEGMDYGPRIPARAPVPSPAVNKLPHQELHGVERHPDGKATIKLGPEAGPLDFIRSMVVMMRPSLLSQHLKTAEHWVSGIAKEPIHGGRWSPKHDDILVRGFERFLWEGDASIEADSGLRKIRELLRKIYPNIAGSRIDVPLTDDMRRMFRAWFAKKPGGSLRV